MRSGARAAVLCAAFAVAAASAGTAARAAAPDEPPPGTPPASGRYAATLCVTSASQTPSCGPAELSVRGPDVVLQVADIVWRLRLSGRQAAVVVTQGSVQIDEFDAGAQWSGASLRFDDDDKRLRYEVQVGARRTR